MHTSLTFNIENFWYVARGRKIVIISLYNELLKEEFCVYAIRWAKIWCGVTSKHSATCTVYARSTFDPRALSGLVLRGRTPRARFRAVIRGAARGRAVETDGRS